MDPTEVEDLIKDLDKEKTGFIDIMAFTEMTHEKDKNVETLTHFLDCHFVYSL